MGWLRTLFLGDIGNRLDIADTERGITDLRIRLSQKRSTDRDQDQRIAELEQKTQTLELGIAALSRLLVARGVLQQRELNALAKRADDDDEP